MEKLHGGILDMPPKFFSFFCFLSLYISFVHSQSQSNDASVMQDLKKSINPPSSLNWVDSDPCNWKNVQCSKDKRVTRIQIGNQNLKGSLPPNLNNLTALQVFEVQSNQLTGSLPSFSGLNSLETLLLNNNNFTSIPFDFFYGMTSLQAVYLDYNAFSSWVIPESLTNASTLQTFSAVSANIKQSIPHFLFNGNIFAGLTSLHLSYNYLEGELPPVIGSSIQSLWLNGQNSNSKLNGTISVIQNMTELTEVWFQSNSFTGPLPDFSGLTQLKSFSVRDNSITGLIPDSLVKLPTLETLNLTNNMLQGPTPEFSKSVNLDMIEGSNSFCLPTPGSTCDPQINTLLGAVKEMGYPTVFGENWKGNNPCDQWRGITCNNIKNITVVNFQNMGLTGSISPRFSELFSLQKLLLANNNLTGIIPNELTSLLSLQLLDVSNNQLFGQIPVFKNTVVVKTDGNTNLGKDVLPPPPPSTPTGAPPSGTPGSGGAPPSGTPGSGGAPPSGTPGSGGAPPSGTPGSGGAPPSGTPGSGGGKSNKSSTGMIWGSIIGGGSIIAIFGGLYLYIYRKPKKSGIKSKDQNNIVINPRNSGSDQNASSSNIGTSDTHSINTSGPNDIESGNMMISIQVLRNVTDNFSEKNILGKGGFGTVYKGELHDGTKIAVKRMESGVITEKGLDEFKSEITVLTKVRHRHLVALLGYCLDGNERLIVFEYMPQGTLSQYLFNWREENLEPLKWSQRLIIALDVARGVEYLHGLAQQSFIHRDLKPSNILLSDDLRAKVADFGLVRLAPDGKDGKVSLVTRLAGTFGYLAPEYAVTGRVTTKVDVFSFGVILMELITGRKALDETQEEDSAHLVTWFKRMHINKDMFNKAIDPTINITGEVLDSISTIAELAGHCCGRDPHLRPDMSHVVNVLSSLTEFWKPTEPDVDEAYGIDYDMSLPQAIMKWQALEGRSTIDSSSSCIENSGNTQSSIPNRPSGFAHSFTSTDGR